MLSLLASIGVRWLYREDLLAQIWVVDWIGESQTLYVHIRWLREQIETDPGHS